MKTVVLGAGIVGVTTAYFLAKGGEQVTVLERQPGVALETSFANAGLVAPGHSYTWASPRAPRIMLKSLYTKGQALRVKLQPDWRMWVWCWRFLQNCTTERSQLNTARKLRLCRYSQAQLQAVTEAESLAYERVSRGLLYVYRDDASFERGIANMSILMENGLRLETLDRAATVACEPSLAAAGDKFVGAIYCPSDESGDAHMFTEALYERCVKLGVIFHFNTNIKRLSGNQDRVHYVETSRGRLSADRYVIALGSFSPIVARSLGYRLQVYPVKGYSVTLPIEAGHSPPQLGGVDENNLAAWARLGNRLRITATAEFAGFDTHHVPDDFTRMLNAARDLFPNGANYERPTYWAGLRPMTPEGTPIIGATRHRNLYLNTGHGHMGWTMACGTARILGDLMQGRQPDLDITGLTLQ